MADNEVKKLQVTGSLRGPAGSDGKSAYEYAQEAGYIGTEAEFAKKLAVPIVTPQMYGALGNGSTDDTAAFQDALTENRVVNVPGGTYKLSGELVIGDNCCLELSQDTVLEFTQTSGNCINLGLSSNLKGNHATVKVPYAFDGHVLHAYSNDRTSEDINAVPPWSRWDPQWKTGRYVSDLNICKADNRGFHYCVNLGECKGTAVYISADNTVGLSTFMWGVHYTGLRIAGAFAYGIHAQNFDDGWLHEMRIDGFIDACETGVCLEDCQNTYISAIIQPRRGYTEDKVYFPYAKYGIKLMRSKNTDLSGSRVWDWSNPDKPNTTENEKMTLYEEGNEYQHIAMYGDCQGTILNDYLYHRQGDTRNRIYTDTLSNLNTLTILQEPIDRWFKVRNGDPYYNTGSFDKKLITEEMLAEHFTTDLVKNFTDILPEATDADGTVYGEVGYKNGYLSAQGSAIDSAYYCVTGFMPIKSGQTFYVNDMTFATYDGLCRISVYDANKNCIRSLGASGFVGGGNWHFGYTALPYGFSATINAVADNKDVAYVRFSVYKRNVGSYPMVSIDEPIKYTIEGFLADGVKVKGENVIGNVGETTPDWVATKELVGGDIVYIPEQTLSSGLWKNLQMSLQPGLAYDVTFNGEVYACVARANGNGAILGNNSALTLNDYPFCIQWAGGTATSGMFFKSSDISYPVTLKLTDHAEYVYDKMPEGYLPNCAVKSVNGNKPDLDGNVEIDVDSGSASIDVTASVGQTIVVEEVDANGKPTKWKAAEYQPRTHYDEVILPETTVEIDPDMGFGLIPNEFTVEGGKKYTVKYNGVDYVTSCMSVMDSDGEDAVEAFMLGNAGSLGEGFEGLPVTNDPFAIMYGAIGEDDEGNYVYAWVVFPLDGSASVTLCIVEPIPIPQPYVSNAFPYYIDVTYERDDPLNTSGSYSCADTVKNVEANYDIGRNIVVRLSDNSVPNAVLIMQLCSAVDFRGGIDADGDGKVDQTSYSPYGVTFMFTVLGYASANQTLGKQLYLQPQQDGTYLVSEIFGD